MAAPATPPAPSPAPATTPDFQADALGGASYPADFTIDWRHRALHWPGLPYPVRAREALNFAATCAFIGAAAPYAFAVEPLRLRAIPHTVPIPGLHAAFDGYRIAHLSDAHVGRYCPVWLLRRAAARARAFRPHTAVFTGDLATRYTAAELEAGAATLARTAAPDGVFACLGNHDRGADVPVKGAREPHPPAPLMAAYAKARVRLLVNAHALIHRGESALAIAGIDDLWAGRPDFAGALAGVAPEVPRVVLVHNPDGAHLEPRVPAHVVLSGHVHAGQFRLPFTPPPYVPVLKRETLHGECHLAGRTVIVSAGIGYSFAGRLLCPPDIRLITLRRVPA